jgi:hypothetical protein
LQENDLELVIMDPDAVTANDQAEETRMMRKVDEFCISPPDGTKKGYILPSGGNDTTTQFCIRVRHSPIFHLMLSFKTEEEVRAELSRLGSSASKGKGHDRDEEGGEDDEDEDGEDDDSDDDSDNTGSDDGSSRRRESKELRRVRKLRRLIGGAPDSDQESNCIAFPCAFHRIACCLACSDPGPTPYLACRAGMLRLGFLMVPVRCAGLESAEGGNDDDDAGQGSASSNTGEIYICPRVREVRLRPPFPSSVRKR